MDKHTYTHTPHTPQTHTHTHILYTCLYNVLKNFSFSTDEVDYKGQSDMNPSEHSYELYLHADRSADQVKTI
jgi:hypothetical protein